MIISVSCSEDAKEKVVLEKNKVLFAATIEGGEDEVVELPHMIRYNELVPVGKRTIVENVSREELPACSSISSLVDSVC